MKHFQIVTLLQKRLPIIHFEERSLLPLHISEHQQSSSKQQNKRKDTVALALSLVFRLLQLHVMSTLLKKKYCFEQSGGETTKISSVSNDDESNDMCLSTFENGDKAVRISTAVSLPSSPVSITPSSDEDSAQSSILQLITETTETADCTGGICENKKSVRFSDVNKTYVDKDYSEKVHKYRANIWYTREEYRTFWNDRMNSVKLWKCLFDDNDDLRSNGTLGAYSDFTWDGKEFTARGLENYIFSSSEEMNRQRDLYTVAALTDPYDADRILAHVCDMSTASLKRAQNYALHDSTDSYRDYAKELNSYRNGDTQSISSRSAHTMSPASVLPKNIFHQIGSPTKDLANGITSIREMNKRLIKGHLNGNVNESRTSEQTKLKRRASTSESFMLAHESNLTFAKRRRSISFSANNYRQPVSLNQQRQRPSMADDFNQHMQFCNRLLNDLPKIDHGSYRRDSLKLTGRTGSINRIEDRVDTLAWNYYPGNTNIMSMDDEFILQQQMRRDSLSGSRKRLSLGINADMLTSSMDSRAASVALLNNMRTANGTPFGDDRSLLRQMILEQKQVSLNDSAVNEYTNYVRGYSRLRRDSLGGNFGL